MGKYGYTFKFFDTMQQAENFKTELLKSYKNNFYYIRKYANKIFIGNWISTNKKEEKIIVHYYC